MKKDYVITTKSEGSNLTFLTQAKNIRGAVKQLIKNSSDFKMTKSQKSVTIKIMEDK